MVKANQLLSRVLIDNYKLYLVLFVVGIIVYFFRQHGAFINPYLFTEDGVWLSMIMNNGLVDSLLHARTDYLVVGNILLLKLVLVINTIFFGDNLTYLPQIISFVGYAYYSFIALSVVIFLKQYLDIGVRLLIFCMLLFIPMGASSFEIIDKISNIGYLLFFLAFLILVWRLKTDKNNIWIIPADILLIISCPTNPACYSLIALYLIYELFSYVRGNSRLKLKKTLKKNIKTVKFVSLIIMLLILTVIMLYIGLHNSTVINHTKHTLLYSNLIQLFARFLLYPIISPLYGSLNNIVALISLIFFMLIMSLSIYFLRHTSASKIFNFIFLALILFSVITVVARPSLTHNLTNYSSSPDRYFLVHNYFVVTLIVIIFSTILKDIKKYNRLFVRAIFFIFVLTSLSYIVVSFKYIFPNHTKQVARTNFTPWVAGISKSFNENRKNNIVSQNNYTIDIASDGWKASLQPKYVYATLANKRKSSYNEVIEVLSVSK